VYHGLERNTQHSPLGRLSAALVGLCFLSFLAQSRRTVGVLLGDLAVRQVPCAIHDDNQGAYDGAVQCHICEDGSRVAAAKGRVCCLGSHIFGLVWSCRKGRESGYAIGGAVKPPGRGSRAAMRGMRCSRGTRGSEGRGDDGQQQQNNAAKE
jgi:hypothetical protein